MRPLPPANSEEYLGTLINKVLGVGVTENLNSLAGEAHCCCCFTPPDGRLRQSIWTATDSSPKGEHTLVEISPGNTVGFLDNNLQDTNTWCHVESVGGCCSEQTWRRVRIPPCGHCIAPTVEMKMHISSSWQQDYPYVLIFEDGRRVNIRLLSG
jgi:hypothetical protein